MRVVRRRKFPIAALAVVMLLALGTIGLVYSNWDQSFTINGNVSTAQLNAKWQVPSGCFETEVKGKEVATATITLDGDKLSVAIVNGYPTFVAECFFSLRNNGKLPIEVGSLGIKGSLPLTGCATNVKGTQQATMTCDQLIVDILDGSATQLNEGQKDGFTITVTVLKGAEEGRKYDFQAQICVEPVNTDQCVANSDG